MTSVRIILRTSAGLPCWVPQDAGRCAHLIWAPSYHCQAEPPPSGIAALSPLSSNGRSSAAGARVRVSGSVDT